MLLGQYVGMPALAQRNERWFPKIEEALKTNDQALLAVGAAHLIEYNAGILKWLQEKGYSLEKADKTGNFTPYFYSTDPELRTKPKT